MNANTNEYLMKEARKSLAKQGGEATKKKHGVEHYKEMSRKGVEARRFNKSVKEHDHKVISDVLYCNECMSTPCQQL